MVGVGAEGGTIRPVEGTMKGELFNKVVIPRNVIYKFLGDNLERNGIIVN